MQGGGGCSNLWLLLGLRSMEDERPIRYREGVRVPFSLSFQFHSVRICTIKDISTIRIDTNAGGMHWVLYVDVDEQTSSTILCNPMLWSVSLISISACQML
jgi:hypothetical protein